MTQTQLSPAGRFERILLATDGSEFSAGAARVAIAMAQKCGAPLRVMTIVLTNPEYESVAPGRVAEAERQAADLLSAVVRDAEAAGVRCESVARRGEDPADVIVAEAESCRADVVVMGRRGRRGLARWMVGHATVKVIAKAPCPVLVVPRNAEVPSRGVLVATDGSRYGDSAAIAGGSLAQRCQLPLTVMSVTRGSHNEARRQEAQQTVDRLCELLRSDGLTAEGVVRDGDRVDETIVAAAQERGADLIVLGSHGRTGLERVLVGSVSERVVGLATSAVLVVGR